MAGWRIAAWLVGMVALTEVRLWAGRVASSVAVAVGRHDAARRIMDGNDAALARLSGHVRWAEALLAAAKARKAKMEGK